MKLDHLAAVTVALLAALLGACSPLDLHPNAAADISLREPGIERGFTLAFSDEYDASKFDLAGRSFRLTYLGEISRMVGGVRSTLYEFAFSDTRIASRYGPTHGNVFMSLSSPLDEDCGVSLGARVLMFDVDGSTVPVGRALLTPQCQRT